MVSASADNETNNNNEVEMAGEEVPPAPAAPAEPSSERVRLPMQLSRLPADRLLKVHQALQELQEAGLSEVPNLSQLSKVVKKKTASADNSRLPEEEHTSSYMAMTLWSWTPKRWFENIQGQGKAAGAKSEDVVGNEGNDGDQLPPLDEAKLQANFERKLTVFEEFNNRKDAAGRAQDKVDIEAFKTWFAAMKESDAQLRAFCTMDSSAKQEGDGVGVLFDKLPVAGGPRVLPKVNVSGFKEGGAISMGEGGGAKANPATSIITIQLGNEGCSAATEIWKRYCSEHQLDGSCRPKDGEFYGTSNPLFAASTTGRYIPRAILASYDSSDVDAVSEAGLFNPTCLFSGSRDGKQSFYDGQGDSSFIEEIQECLRRQKEEADYVEGYMFVHNGTQDAVMNGVASKLMQELSGQKANTFCFTGVADSTGDVSEEDAKVGFLLHEGLIEYTDIVSFYDRKSLTKMASGKVNGLGISSPDDVTLNGLLARLLSGVTGPMRFNRVVAANTGMRSASMQAIATNLCSYPRIKYMLPSLGGLTAKGMEDFAVGKPGQEKGADACQHALKRGYLCNGFGEHNSEKIIAYSMFCRGVELSSAVSRVADLKTCRDYQFVDWCPTGFSIYCFKDQKATEPEVAVLENNCGVGTYVNRCMEAVEQFRAQLEESGVESGAVSEACENLAALGKDYQEVAAETAEECWEDEEEEF